MPIRIVPDEGQPSAAVEIPIEKPLPDYDLSEIEQPTPRNVDSILVSQGFRDLVDDARGVLMEILASPADIPGIEPGESKLAPLQITDHDPIHLEIAQLTGAICPDHEQVYRPGLWIVLRDAKASPKKSLPQITLDRIAACSRELVKRLQLE